ncbi:MAG: hypothetical protein K6F45_04275 [Saccharofermentans sp.]|nr:hypothetical protein [Saccharofermentans sp.]
MRRILKKLSTALMTAVMVFAMTGCATYSAPTTDAFCTALDELGYHQVQDAANAKTVTEALMSFAAFGGGGYLVMNYDDPYDMSITGHIRGCTSEVLCITEKGTRYLLLVFDNSENAKFYYDTMKNQVNDVYDKSGAFITKPGINAECYTFAGTYPSLFEEEYMYGGFYFKDNTVTIIDTYENDITNKTQVNQLLDKLGLPRP